MPSASLILWRSDRLLRLVEIDGQCAACAATSPPSPRLIEETLRGYILLISAHFQGYCRDLYSESAQVVAARVRPSLRLLVQEQFTAHRRLDQGNPNIENLKKDFNRFGFELRMAQHDPANHGRLADLRRLNDWRNIAAHHGVVPIAGVPSLATIRSWRDACDLLAASLDEIMYNQLRRILRRAPWIP